LKGLNVDANVTNQQLNEAIRMLAELQQANPTDATLSVVGKQLAYLKETYDREKAFTSVQKDKLTFGVIAAKNEYDVNYPKFADLLHEISYALTR